MATVPSKDPRYNFDIVPDPPLERFIAGAFQTVVAVVMAFVGLAVLVWAWRTIF